MTGLDKWIQIFDSISYSPILDSILLYLTIADALILCQVCKGLSHLKHYALKKITNINCRLQDFVDDPVIFRSQLGQYEALVSGAFARGLFDLKPKRVLYLDVFIREGGDAQQFAEYLKNHESYTVEKETVRDSMHASRQISYISSSRPGLKLRTTVTRGSPIRHILASSYTTACVNIMTWNKAFSMFPIDTLVKHRFYPLKSFDDGFGSCLRELAYQGWTTRDIIWPDLDIAKRLGVTRLRLVGDKFSPVIPLDTNEISPPTTPNFVITYAQFEILEDTQPWPALRQSALLGEPSRQFLSPKGSFLRLRAEEMVSASIRYAYTTGSNSWKVYVGERLRRWAWLELFKIGIEGTRWLSLTTFPLVSEISDFDKPETWDYADDQIPNWYLEWEKQSG
ncbi:hypothetical protein B0I35DRAFT_403084 [Stachybotrys elegans]|uniref:Uncharacterized protein n=1 Tax=Stachybotrys elegans TaxID=80388 RepID=A0A8K0SC14_9HYPO|nr:hypothetical protein B0I35DRAFT_403084 [Stachybotrys elegans]